MQLIQNRQLDELGQSIYDKDSQWLENNCFDLVSSYMGEDADSPYDHLKRGIDMAEKLGKDKPVCEVCVETPDDYGEVIMLTLFFPGTLEEVTNTLKTQLVVES